MKKPPINNASVGGGPDQDGEVLGAAGQTRLFGFAGTLVLLGFAFFFMLVPGSLIALSALRDLRHVVLTDGGGDGLLALTGAGVAAVMGLLLLVTGCGLVAVVLRKRKRAGIDDGSATPGLANEKTEIG